mgnify:CR=1 FL=1
MKTKLLGVLAATLIAASSAQATVMDFTGLVDFSNFSQNGMDMVSNNVWNWPGANEAHMDSGIATFKLATLGDFNLDSVDMNSSGGVGPARFEAFDNGVSQGFVDIAGGAGTFIFGAAFDGIDEFHVTVPFSHFTFDNLNFDTNSVPEPGTYALLLAGLLGFSARRRKQANAA